MGSDLNNQLDVQGWICRHSGLVSRPLRIAVENGWYHVLNRGIDGRQLFSDDRANEHFLELLKSMPARFNLRIHAFVLMGNHYHLQIETLKPELSRAIQWLNLCFSGWYNRMELVSGLRWQGQETGLAKHRNYPSVVRQRSGGKLQVSLPASTGRNGWAWKVGGGLERVRKGIGTPWE